MHRSDLVGIFRDYKPEIKKISIYLSTVLVDSGSNSLAEILSTMCLFGHEAD